MTYFSIKPSLIAVLLLELVSLSDEGPYLETLEFFIINSAVYQPFNFQSFERLPRHQKVAGSISV